MNKPRDLCRLARIRKLGSCGGWSFRPARSNPIHPIAVSRADGRIDVFFRAGDGSLGFARQDVANGTTFTWHNVEPSVFVGDPVPAANRVYVTSMIGDLWEATDNGADGYTFAQALPNPAGVTLMTSPAAVAGSSNGVNNTVFVLGSDRALWHTTRTSLTTFSGWTSDGGAFNSGLTVSGTGLPGPATLSASSVAA